MHESDGDVNDIDYRNEVLLVGRLGAVPEPRTLPSGDEIVTFRVVVDRAAARARFAAGVASRPSTPSTAPSATAVLRRRLSAGQPGDVVEVEGSAAPSVLACRSRRAQPVRGPGRARAPGARAPAEPGCSRRAGRVTMVPRTRARRRAAGHRCRGVP